MVTASTDRPPALRLTARECRAVIVDMAMHEFALGGFDGAAAAVIALRAGVSQPLRYVLAEQAMRGVAAAMDLPEAWS